MKVVFLGTGTSHGVPSIDCMLDNHARCSKGVCAESVYDPRHRRTRSSILVQTQSSSLLVDVTPDFREQMLRERVARIDAVLMTHKHADHLGGIPDIRSYTRKPDQPLDLYGSAETVEAVRNQYGYIFDPDTFVGGGIPRLTTHTVDGPFCVGEQTIVPVPVIHGPLKGCFGYRLGALAYVPDMKEIPESSLQLLQGTDTLILNCLRETHEHSTHMILSQSIDLARRIRPRVCWFIHMCHDIHYRLDKPKLDSWMDFAWDGLSITI